MAGGTPVIHETIFQLAKSGIPDFILVNLSKDDDMFGGLPISDGLLELVRPIEFDGKSFDALKNVLVQRDKDADRIPLLAIKNGGAERRDTVLNAIQFLHDNGLANEEDLVFVHDAARCCVNPGDVKKLAALGDGKDGAILAIKASDTLKKSLEGEDSILETISRKNVWRAQTPQMFRLGILKEALERSEGDSAITDEASAVEKLGLHPRLVEGSSRNIKVTYPEDLVLAGIFMSLDEDGRNQNTNPQIANNLSTKGGGPMLRIGEGFDVHRMEEGRDLILGGVKIPHDKGLKGHSDADALLHAITDAIFGALALGDIGNHFPDTDPKYKGADSAVLLKEAMDEARRLGWSIVNLDSTIICQAPKLAPHIQPMRKRVAQILDLPVELVSIKAKTNEKLGYLGAGEAIETRCVVLLAKNCGSVG